MQKISSQLTWWYKKAFPTLYFGILGLFTLLWIPSVILQRVPAPMLLIPVGLAVFGYFMMRWLVFSLMDGVFIEDKEIIVRNRGDEAHFPITNIMNIEAPLMVNPERFVLTLKEPCRFGSEIAFSPPFRWWHFTRNPLADELMCRAYGMDCEEVVSAT